MGKSIAGDRLHPRRLLCIYPSVAARQLPSPGERFEFMPSFVFSMRLACAERRSVHSLSQRGTVDVRSRRSGRFFRHRSHPRRGAPRACTYATADTQDKPSWCNKPGAHERGRRGRGLSKQNRFLNRRVGTLRHGQSTAYVLSFNQSAACLWLMRRSFASTIR